LADTPHYVSDDPETVLVMIQYGLKKGWLKRCPCKDEVHYDFDETRQDEFIANAIHEGYFQLHMELGEWYYHPTSAGLELLRCQCCNDVVYTDEDLKKGAEHFCKE